MKHNFIALLIINELCDTTDKKPKNTGHSGAQCLEGVMERVAVAKKGFSFDSVEDFKDKAKWLEAIENKDIVPLFDAFVVTPANTEATNYTAGSFKYQTSPAVKVTTFESYLGFCSHAALKSYAKSEYTQVFEFNNDGSIVGVDAGPGTGQARKVKGQELSDLNVGIRTVATAEKPAFSLVTLTYDDYNELEDNAVVVKPTWRHADIDGIYDVELTQVGTASATSIKFSATRDCGKTKVTTFVAADIIVRDPDGGVETVTFVAADADGVYTVTGTGFTTGTTVEVDGVVAVSEVLYEGVEVLTVTVTP